MTGQSSPTNDRMLHAGRKRREGGSRLALLVLLGVGLSSCGSNRVVTSSTFPYDYRERHPIEITDKPEALDVFVTNGNLGHRQVDDVRAFAASYLRHGKSRILAFVPADTGQEAAVRNTLAAARRVLAASGIRSSDVMVSGYHPGDANLAPVVRLSFIRLGAKVAGSCGKWPQDLASGSSTDGWKNRPYWNLGCASQANLAAQVADPLDLVRPRPEGPIDTQKRLGAIEKLRKGQDPSTQYNDAMSIENGVGQ
ncbi:CpaD family pilus assembly protein [Chelatococcus sp. GCM10030263]|uniref:CpaD family pilus assembly protein n=1 Tax=Chelatococcus sp. GCM10030263 TaxID=3273387 RepID=UPI00361EF6EB